MHHESHYRTIVKTISWKIVAAILTFTVSYTVTGDLALSSKFTGVWTVLGLIAYYLHERLWNKIHWGKSHREEGVEA